MPFELLSGFLGATLSEVVFKIAPARRTGEFSDIPFETLQRRNRWLYRGLMGVGCLGFLAPTVALAEHWQVGNDDPWGPAWFAGVFFGLPFAMMLVFLGVTWFALGGRRTRELLFYFERKLQTHIYVFYAFGAPLSVLGAVSLWFLWR